MKHLLSLGLLASALGMAQSHTKQFTVYVEAPEVQTQNSKPWDGAGDVAIGPVFQRYVTPLDMVLCVLELNRPTHTCYTDDTVMAPPATTGVDLAEMWHSLGDSLELDNSTSREIERRTRSFGDWFDRELGTQPSVSICVDTYVCQWQIDTPTPPYALYVYDDDTDSVFRRVMGRDNLRYTELVDIIVVTGDNTNPRDLVRLKHRIVYEVAGHGDEDLATGYRYRNNKTRFREQQVKVVASAEECRINCPLGQSVMTLTPRAEWAAEDDAYAQGEDRYGF